MRGEDVGGDILFMASLAAAVPWPFHLPYAAANAGVEQAARTLPETAGLVVMGLGGAVAVASGLVFLWIVIASWRRARAARLALRARRFPSWTGQLSRS